VGIGSVPEVPLESSVRRFQKKSRKRGYFQMRLYMKLVMIVRLE
jgi:hypothetical protein